MRKTSIWIALGSCLFGSVLVTSAAFARDKKLVAPDPPSPLVGASVSGDIDLVNDLIGRGADVNGRDSQGNFPLYAAVVGDHAEVVELLIKKGGDVNQKKAANVLPVLERNTSPLHAASIVGNPSVVKLLVDAGANLNAFADLNEEKARSYKNTLDNTQISRFLTPDAVAILRSQMGEIGVTPLTQASRFDHADIVALLLDRGADINFQRPGNNTALIEAAVAGSRDVIQLLIARKADLNRTGLNGGTALALALSNEQYESARILLAAGADFHLDDLSTSKWKRRTAWGAYQSLCAERLVAEGKNTEAKDLFIEARASLTAVRDELTNAAEDANKKSVKAEKDARSAGRWANVVSVSEVAVPVLTDFSRTASQRQMAQIVALKNARTPDEYFQNFDALERRTQLATPAAMTANTGGNESANATSAPQIMRESAQSMHESAQLMQNSAQLLTEKATACDYLIRHISGELATIAEAGKTH